MIFNTVLRRLRREQRFVLFVLLTMAGSFGFYFGLYAVKQAVLDRSIGVSHPRQIIRYAVGNPQGSTPFSGPLYAALHAYAPSRHLALWNGYINLLIGREPDAEQISGALVSGNFFHVFDLQPALGRFFDSNSDRPGGGKDGWQAVLSYSYWNAHYHLSPEAIGKVLILNGVPVHIIGILPQTFRGLSTAAPAKIFLPSYFLSVLDPTQNEFLNPGDMEWQVFERIPEGSTLRQINAQLHAIDQRVINQADPQHRIYNRNNFPVLRKGWLISAVPGQYGVTFLQSHLRLPLRMIQFLGLALLLVGMCNVLLLFRGRAVRMAHEVSIRIALGASRRNIVSLCAAEAFILVMAGTALAIPIGILFAHILTLFVQSTPGFSIFPAPRFNFLFIIYAIVLGLGLMLAIVVTTTSKKMLHQPIKAISAGRKFSVLPHARFPLLGMQVLLSSCLASLAATGLIGISILIHSRSGFLSQKVVTTSITSTDATQSQSMHQEMMQNILAKIDASPGVIAASTINVLPLSGDQTSENFSVIAPDGQYQIDSGLWPANVSFKYFEASGTQILRGRDFNQSDLASTPVCVISKRASGIMFGKTNPVGKSIFTSGTPQSPYCNIIGVAENAHFSSISNNANAVIYRLTRNDYDNIIVHAASANLGTQAINTAFRSLAPTVSISSIESIHSLVMDELKLPSILDFFALLTALITIALMCAGIFGFLSLEVAAKRLDFAVMMALGGRKITIVKSACKQIFKPIAIGLFLGLLLAVPAARIMYRNYLSANRQPWGSEIAAAAAIILAVFFAIALPIQQALRVSPSECLRNE